MAPVNPANSTRPGIFALLLMLACPAVWGLSGDRSQPIHIEADSAILDESKGISVYEGNVLLRQGTLQLRGTRMAVHLTGNQVEKVVLTGQPASYSQQLDDEGSIQQARAGRIEYQAGSQRMILQDDARIWREESEEFSSDRIVVNLQENTLSAGGDGPDDRVHIILQPGNWQTEEPATGQ